MSAVKGEAFAWRQGSWGEGTEGQRCRVRRGVREVGEQKGGDTGGWSCCGGGRQGRCSGCEMWWS